MPRTSIAALAGAILLMSALENQGAEPKAKRFDYPPAPRSETVDDYHGTKVPDPYRPLEDPDSAPTRSWIEAENKITYGYLDGIAARPKIKTRLTKLWDFEKFGLPSKEGGRYFFSRNSGLQNQAVLFTAPSLDAEPKVLLDPNTLSKDGTVAVSGTFVSHDGSLLAYTLAEAGSDWMRIKVREVESAKDRDDTILWVKSSGVAWPKEGKGFYYSRFPEPEKGADLRQANFNHAVYYHELGKPQSDDKLVFSRPDHKEWMMHAGVSDDGRYLVLSVSKSTDDKNRVLYQDLTQKDAQIVELIDNFEAGYDFVDNVGSTLYFKTNKGAPRGRVVTIDLADVTIKEPVPVIGRPSAQIRALGIKEAPVLKEVIPQAAEALQGVSLVGQRLFASYLKDAHTQVKVFKADGTLDREVEFPGLGTVAGFGGKKDDEETFYSFVSFTRPATIYRYEVPTGKSTVYKEPKVAFDPDDYATKQVFYTSKDGTKVPMFLSYKKTTKLDTGAAPTYLYGYGGFNIPITPTFSPSSLLWMEAGGVYAVANLRGGGEYGEDWHEAGTKLKKQNVFDDFIGAAEWLIREKVTSTPKLGIEGRSNGGLLVGACLTQRPELFGAAVPGVGVLDMLRFHKFTIGYLWTDDYGSADVADQFPALLKYSPLHNIKPGTCYPPTLVITADHDDRVVPAHSFKFAATLQAAQSCDNPVLIRIETKAGHGAGKPTAKVIDEATDKWAFLVKALGVEWPE